MILAPAVIQNAAKPNSSNFEITISFEAKLYPKQLEKTTVRDKRNLVKSKYALSLFETDMFIKPSTYIKFEKYLTQKSEVLT